MPTPSRDRVRFKIPSCRLSKHGSESLQYRELVAEVFGETLGRCDWGDVIIICRPSQFARFVIRRHEMGIQNMFAELEAELFTPEDKPTPTVFDVSNNPHKPRKR